MYKFMSKQTGELNTNIFNVIHTILFDLRHYHFLNYKWSYNKKGF